MAFDETLAARVRSATAGTSGVIEKKMFGGLAFLLNGNMSVGIHGSDLIVRLSPAEAEMALRQDSVRAFDITGKPMKGWLLVSPSALADDKLLASWVRRATAFAGSLPPK